MASLQHSLHKQMPLEVTAQTGSLGITASQVLLAGLCFGSCEVLLRRGPARQYLQSIFKCNEDLKKNMDETISQAITRIIGFLHVAIQLPIALYIMWSPDFSADRLYSNTSLSYLLTTVSAGYFLYDLYVCLFRYEGPAYLMHGAVCFALYTYTAWTGFLHFYAAMFLMWEVSTPCVYARWFLAHIGRHNTRLYIANGLAMLATFFVARNCLGLLMSVNFFRDSIRELRLKQGGMSAAMLYVYQVANVCMNSLNALWFYKMAKGAVRVLTGSKHKKGTPPEASGQELKDG